MVPAALIPRKADLEPIHQALVPAYVDYCSTVSKRSMAISDETATFLLHLCMAYEARTVCDLGSGFTSYVLAMYAYQADWPVTVHSVDDSPEWLDATGRFLDKHGLASDLMLIGDWLHETSRYDVIVVDYARGAERNRIMPIAAAHLNLPGAMLFDDAQNDDHAAVAVETAREHGLRVIDIRDLTIDQVRRFALLAVQ